MKDLTGTQAVERLERRGGQIWVFRKGYGADAEFSTIAREDGHAVVVGKSTPRARQRYGPHRFVLGSLADREQLASDMDRAIEVANADLERVEYRYELVHRDIMDTDAGYGQVGCLLAVASVFVGLVVGLIVSLIVTPGISGGSLILAPIVGLLVGFLGIAPVSAVAMRVPAIRDRAELLTYAWFVVVPAVVTAVAMIWMAIANPRG